jgi:hypothetical protein
MPKEEVAIMLRINFNMAAKRQLLLLPQWPSQLTQRALSVVVLLAVRVDAG